MHKGRQTVKASTTKKYLALAAELQSHKNRSHESIEQFVLDHGIKCGERIEKPVAKNLREPKGCFRNASLLALETNLIYVEGWAMSVIPLHHAWCITSDGRVVDPTWETGEQYVGVPFQTKWLRRYLCETQIYGVFYKRGIAANVELLKATDFSKIIWKEDADGISTKDRTTVRVSQGSSARQLRQLRRHGMGNRLRKDPR